ncbi:DUF3277 domain-containing protein [Sporolactobacillus shoreicorticis]|uniref:Phage structural protein n=1 Tax=Sporolactobacillus shoreicorticis TaxID=1923877 RepID=A0ABW5S5I5_9BACL|nr:DUF3277 domain-containing protein [Sporolactobacillus shoreicorticis]MCO7127817.1 DUF3277 domain-containing protein [Sporolactobacillus shoreicorticis]
MSNEVHEYDANNVTVTVDGVVITGYSDGSLVEASQDNDNFDTKVSAQGDVGVATSNNPLGTIKLTLAQTSPSVSYLNKLANAKKTIAIWATSNSEIKEKVGGTKAKIKKPADVKLSKSIEDREFEFSVFDYAVI